MTLPSASTFSTYGGAKEDFTSVVDPLTDRSAVEVNAAFADVASMTRTSIRAYLQFTGVTGDNPVPNFHQAHWGSTVAVVPTMVNNATGDLTITFPATVTDPLGDDVALNLVCGWGSLEGSTPGFINVTRLSPNTVNVKLFDATGAASDLVGTKINVFLV